MGIRCVVTGQTNGKSVVVADKEVDPITVSLLPGAEFHRLWGSNTPPTLPTDGEAPDQTGYFPPPEGYRFGFWSIAPDSEAAFAEVDLEAAIAEVDEKLPGLIAAMEPDHPGMHTTDTVDLDLVISGEVWLELDDGEEVLLRAGDCVIQNGTRHAWHNRSSETTALFTVLLGAVRASS
jgi:mannose-6-phosphate isomerase-like protein (cupin superfamily)